MSSFLFVYDPKSEVIFQHHEENRRPFLLISPVEESKMDSRPPIFDLLTTGLTNRAVVVAQLVERLLLSPEIPSSNPDIGQIFINQLYIR